MIGRIIKKIYKRTIYRWRESVWLFVFKIYSRNKEVIIIKNGTIDHTN